MNLLTNIGPLNKQGYQYRSFHHCPYLKPCYYAGTATHLSKVTMNIDITLLQQYAITYGQNLIGALLIFIIGKWVSKRLKSLLERVLEKAKIDKTLISFGGNIAYALLLTFVVIAALGRLGVQTTSLAAIIGAAGLAIGLSMQGSLANLASGVMLLIFRPFKIGDFIEAGGVNGTVRDINIFTTTLTTGDNKRVIIPNASVSSGSITNYSAEKTRRIDLVFGCGYDDDIKKVKDTLIKIVSADKRVLKDPAPKIAVTELADSSVNFVVRPWVKTEDYWNVKFDLTEQVKVIFDQEGISIPYPQQDVYMHQIANDDRQEAA